MPRRRYALSAPRVTIEEYELPEEEEEDDGQEEEEEESDEEEEQEDEGEIRESTVVIDPRFVPYIEIEEEVETRESTVVVDPRFVRQFEIEEEEGENPDVIHTRFISQTVEEDKENQRRSQGGEGVCSTSGSQEDGEWKPGESTEGLSCLICMEAWTNGGEHQICCLPCGHLYGFSCIKKWLQQPRSSGKCPQCNRTCSLRDVRKIFASRIAAVDDEAQKRILYLETKLSSLEQKTASWSNKEAQWRKTEAELRSEVSKLKKKIVDMESTPRISNVASQEQYIPGHKIYQEHHGQAPSCNFRHQGELLINGGRIFDIDGSRQILLMARRLSGAGGTFVLTQMSLHTGDIDDILLPPTTRAIKDLHLSPHNNGLAVFGSLGKKLSVISLESHNTVLSYDLPAAPWSCSWDLNSSHHIYAGLQNGMVLVFDMRQTTEPFASLTGLSTNPVHTIHHLPANSTPTSDNRSLLSASSIGLSQWNINSNEPRLRPLLVTETGNPGVCISSSYCPRSDHVVASFRPRVGSSSSDDNATQTQPSLTQTGVNSNGVDGFHVSLKRSSDCYQKLSSTHASVDTIRLPRTAIIDFGFEQRFASCDEVTRELVLQDPSSFVVSQRFALSSPHPLQDVKYANVNGGGSGLLGLLTDDRLQILRNE